MSKGGNQQGAGLITNGNLQTWSRVSNGIAEHNLASPDVVAGLSGLTLITWNIRSILPKFADFEACVSKMKPDIICVCETWLNLSTADTQVSMPGFNLIRHDRRPNIRKKGGGLCVYTNVKLQYDVDLYNHLNLCNHDIELCVLVIKLIQTKPLVIIACYRPPPKGTLMRQ